ncbi:tRNA (cytidine(56)-2'-O)-methyltransferase [Candidatus Micrarchaeota archaeon]|nr:tRNA (cytidine(56)-2'-O)-methyltransferase [Candidatus Micrarchaeota archaeon]MBU1930824.1 tRNA (cytidine(56)-2'-O)-methyltransferase [Candidatus Micrarchaeota archaeon]
MDIAVVRLGHRIGRDVRTTTHVCLTARALGAKQVIVCGDNQTGLLQTVRKIVKKWGGAFKIQYSGSDRKAIKTLQKQGYCAIHATMYGQPIQTIQKKIWKKRKIAIVVGAEKVPKEIYQLADYNVSVTNQPHSEIAALAIILDQLQHGKELTKKFSKPKIKIVPSARNKKVKTR